MARQCNDHARVLKPTQGTAARPSEGREHVLPRRRTLAVPITVLALIGLAAGCTSAGETGDGSPTPVAVATPTSAALMPMPSTGALPAESAAEFQSLLDAWVAADYGVGVTAAVVSSEGTWAGAAGVDGAGNPLVPESAMAIASITKTFVAAEVMRLVGQGLVDLDAPISDYVVVPFDTRGATVRQVLAMRSGFPVDPFDTVVSAAADDLDRDWTTDEVLALVDAKGPRQGALGGSADYNNLNYQVLGMLIEQVTGQPFESALRRDLLDPAGLDRVWVQDGEQPQPPLTVGVEDPEWPVVDADGSWLPSRSLASAVGAAGGMAADAPGVARWGYLLYGGYVIDSTLVQQMTTGGPEDWYGLGTSRWTTEDGDLAVGHDAGLPAYHGAFVVVPDQAASIAVLVPEPERRPVLDLEATASHLLDQLAQAALED